jgi:hypothetical protein
MRAWRWGRLPHRRRAAPSYWRYQPTGPNLGKDAAQRSRSYLRSDSVNLGEYAAVVTYSLHETFTVRVHVGRDDAGRLTYSKKPGPRFSTF